MALLHYIKARKDEYSITLSAVHLEHGIRGESSLADANFVNEFCKRENIPLILKHVDCVLYAKENKLGIEESARAARYALFYEILASGKADYICTAHHADDNAETVLFNLFRGSALKGVGGIKENKGIIRPMLSVTKEQILNYVKENSILFVTDETNTDTKYTRNFIRQNILPEIKEIFPNCVKRIYSFSQTAREDDEYLYSLAEKECSVKYGAFIFADNLEKPLFTRACMLAFKYFGIEKDYTIENFNDVYSLKNLNNGSKISLPCSLIAIREYGHIAVYRPEKVAVKEIPFAVGEYQTKDKILKIVEGKADGLNIDGDKLPPNAVIRARKQGDKFQKFGSGSKKLKDFFIDKKIPLRERDKIPVIACDDEVYVVCGVEISEKVKLDRNSGKIYTIIY